MMDRGEGSQDFLYSGDYCRESKLRRGFVFSPSSSSSSSATIFFLFVKSFAGDLIKIRFFFGGGRRGLAQTPPFFSGTAMTERNFYETPALRRDTG